MDRLRKAALLARLVDALRAHKSWCGETHVQKATYFLQELLQAPLGFGFILYWYGPFSFDLRNELTALRADDILELEAQTPPYGPRLNTTELGKSYQKRFPKILQQYSNQIDFVADRLGGCNVNELERLATGLLVTRKLGADSPVEKRADELTQIKPHVSHEAAKRAIQEVDGMANDQRKLRAA